MLLPTLALALGKPAKAAKKGVSYSSVLPAGSTFARAAAYKKSKLVSTVAESLSKNLEALDLHVVR